MSWFSKKEGEQKAPDLKNSSDYQHEEVIKEKRLWQLRNIFIAFWIFVVFVIGAFVAVGFFQFDYNDRIVLWASLSIVYAIILYFLLEPGMLREINRTETHTVEKEVVREVPVIKEVRVPVVQQVEKPVIREIIKEVPVIKTVEVPRAKLNIPRYDFIGSVASKVYHKNNCRLGKSIKKKYKEFSNDPNFFKKRGYKPCKFCITKEVKV